MLFYNPIYITQHGYKKDKKKHHPYVGEIRVLSNVWFECPHVSRIIET
jgi:hypothetical protein